MALNKKKAGRRWITQKDLWRPGEMQSKDAAEFSGNDGWSPWSCYVYEDVEIAALAERSPEDPEEQRRPGDKRWILCLGSCMAWEPPTKQLRPSMSPHLRRGGHAEGMLPDKGCC